MTRAAVFQEIYNTLNGAKPTYTDRDSATATYKILAAFPEVTPNFPCIVINPVEQKIKSLGVANVPNKSLPATIDIDFYAKTRDGKNAIDSARDSVQSTLLTKRRYTNFLLTIEPIDDSTVEDIEVGGQRLNTATLTLNIKLI